MKKGLIVLSAGATLLAGILVPTTGFAAEGSSTQPETKNAKVASYEYIPSFIFVGNSFSFPNRYKYPSVFGFDHGVVSIDVFGKVTGMKKGTATIQVWDEDERETKRFYINVY